MTKASCSVDFCKLTHDTEEDAQPIVDAINKCPDLKRFTLSGNKLGVAAAKAITKALKHHPELKIAKFTNVEFSWKKTERPLALIALCDGLIATGARLQSLDLSDNNLRTVAAEPVAKLLASEVCGQLQELRLGNNFFWDNGLLAGALSTSQCRLRVFKATNNSMGSGAEKLAAVLGNMGTLEELDLRNTFTLPAGIAALSQALKLNPRLRSLDLSYVGIYPSGAPAIADALYSLKNLTSLDLASCFLKREGGDALAKAFRENAHSLEYLNLGDNAIGERACMDIVNSFKTPEKLRMLILWGNCLSTELIMRIKHKPVGSRVYCVWCIPNEVWRPSKNDSSDDEETQLKPADVVKDVALESSVIIPTINKRPDLLRLSLSGRTLDVAAARVIAKTLEHHPELKEVKLAHVCGGTNQTEIRSTMSALCYGLRASGARLRSLDLSDSGLGLVGVEPVAELLKSQVCCQLQELRLDYNHLCSASGRLLARALTSSPCRLKLFAARLNELGDGGAKELAAVFGDMGTLEEVDLRGNSISHSGVAALSQAFKRNPQLRRLNLSLNDIGPDGAAAIADALPRLTNIKSLDLGNSRISGGVKGLAKALKYNLPSLETLDLNTNMFGDEACMDVFGSITAAGKLKRLVLAGNVCGGATQNKIRRTLGARAVLHYWTIDSTEEEDSEIVKKLSSVTI